MSSEKEKMFRGELYNSTDNELKIEREYARQLTFEYNATKPHEVEIGDNVLLGPNVNIYTATHPIDPRDRLSG